jgi:hypothetical protein
MSGVCSLGCDSAAPCPGGYRCSVFQTVAQSGVSVQRGYCLRACASTSDCTVGVCDGELSACVTAPLRYDVGSPIVVSDPNCGPLPFDRAGWSAPRPLTTPGEIFVFGPVVAIDPIDPRIRYAAYNSAAGTDISVTRDAGVTWDRIPVATTGFAENIGDPALAINPTTREVWHSFMTGPQVLCVRDQTADSDNSIGIISSQDLGLTWSPPLLADVGPYQHGYFVDRPSIAASGSQIFVTFVAVPGSVDDPRTDLVLTRSSDRGRNWSVSTISGPARPTLRRAPSMRVLPNGAILETWVEKADQGVHKGSIWVARSTDGGNTFSERMVSADVLASEDGPSVAVSGEATLFVVFGASTTASLAPTDIYVVSSTDGGMTFGTPTRLTHACGTAWSPAAAVDSAGDLWTIWYQAVEGISQVGWLRARNPTSATTATTSFGVLPDSMSPFTMSRSPLVSLGDFVGLASSGGALVAAWTSLSHTKDGGGVIHISSAGDVR